MTNRIVAALAPKRNHQLPTGDDRSKDASAAIAGKVKQVGSKIEHLVTSHPGASLGAAVVTGLALGWWLKRK